MEWYSRRWLHEQHCEFAKVIDVQNTYLHFLLNFYLVKFCCYLSLTCDLFFSVSGGSGGENKGKRKQNVVPVQISEILQSPEEGFTVEGAEVGMVVVVGKVTSCEKATTKTTYRVRFIFYYSSCLEFYFRP